MRCMNEPSERQAQKRVDGIAYFRRAVVHVADLAGRVQHENHALGVGQNLLVKIPFPLQPPLCFQLSAHVDEDVDRLRLAIRILGKPGRGNQEAAIREKLDRAVDALLGAATKWATPRAIICRNWQNVADRAPNQLGGMNANPPRESAIDAHDAAFIIMRNDRVLDRIDHSKPILARAEYLLKKLRVLQQAGKERSQKRQTIEKDGRRRRHLRPRQDRGAAKLALAQEWDDHFRELRFSSR